MHNSSFRFICRILSLKSSSIRQINKISYFIQIKSITPTSTKSNLTIKPSISFVQLSSDCGNMSGAGDQKPFTLYYEDLRQAQNDNSALIIDVREQKEIDETGKLPGSIHIPMGVVAKMLELSDNEFKKQFETSKPNKHTKIILSCRAGARSATVQKELQQLGYEKVYNYIGGWSEWEMKQKK